jgi:hypothetical protein
LITLPAYAVIGKRTNDAALMDATRTAQLFEAVDGDNIKFRVFLANLKCSLKFRGIAPGFQRLHAFPSKDHDWAVRKVSR